MFLAAALVHRIANGRLLGGDGRDSHSRIHDGTGGRRFLNWASTFGCRPHVYAEPSTEAEIIALVRLARESGHHVRAVGAGHSPSDIACCEDYLVSLSRLNCVLHVDTDQLTVAVEAGAHLERLNAVLDEHDLALRNIGSISDITVGGALATGTHGTGVGFGIFGTQVLALRLITADGVVLECSAANNPDVFECALLNIGSLGIVVSVTLQCERAFQLRAVSYPAKVAAIEDVFALAASSEHVRMWWFPHTDSAVIWQAHRVYGAPVVDPSSYFWDRIIGYHALEWVLYVASLLPRMVPLVNAAAFWLLFRTRREVVGRSDRVFNFDCLFKQYVNEWAIPIERAPDAIRLLRAAIDKEGLTAHFPVEIRFVAADTIPLSPSYGRVTCYINIIMYRPFGRFVPFRQYWDAYERIMRALGGRPHWAKAHNERRSSLRQMYPRFDAFCAVRSRLDPQGTFENDYTARCFRDDETELVPDYSKYAL
eukprot:Opistho-2@94729